MKACEGLASYIHNTYYVQDKKGTGENCCSQPDTKLSLGFKIIYRYVFKMSSIYIQIAGRMRRTFNTTHNLQIIYYIHSTYYILCAFRGIHLQYCTYTYNIITHFFCVCTCLQTMKYQDMNPHLDLETFRTCRIQEHYAVRCVSESKLASK